MAPLRTVILEVDDAKADSLVEALGKRDYIRVVVPTRAEKKARKTCPWCDHKFPREVTYVVTEEVATNLLRVVEKMESIKSLILVTPKDSISLSQLPDYEKSRALKFDHNVLKRAELLGLLAPFVDGSRKTYFATAKALALFAGKEPVSPAYVVICGGEVVETGGEMVLDDVKFKDVVRKDKFKGVAKKAAARLSKDVVDFIRNGQMSLVG